MKRDSDPPISQINFHFYKNRTAGQPILIMNIPHFFCIETMVNCQKAPLAMLVVFLGVTGVLYFLDPTHDQ